MEVYRPGGITALAIIFLILAILGILGAIAIEVFIVANYYYTMNLNLVLTLDLLRNPSIPHHFAMYYLYTSLMSMMSDLSYVNMLHVGTIAILASSVLYIAAGFGLLYMKKWGYYLALIIGILNIVGGVVSLLSLVGIINLVFGIIIVVYLLGDVKYEFE